MDILQSIAATKRLEVEAAKALVPQARLEREAARILRTPASLRRSIGERDVAVIAEFKRRSPSKGEIAPMAAVADVVPGYARAGAAGSSVLTDTPYFGGALTDLAVARRLAPSSYPLLRKEFVVDPYQIWQARVYGADAILLIASLLTPDEAALFTALAHSLGMEVLFEVHTAMEIAKAPADVDMVGVNNRDLRSFATDIAASEALIASLPANALKVAESGIHSPADIRRLMAVGFDAFLIGEAFMSMPDPAGTLSKFINEANGNF